MSNILSRVNNVTEAVWDAHESGGEIEYIVAARLIEDLEEDMTKLKVPEYMASYIMPTLYSTAAAAERLVKHGFEEDDCVTRMNMVSDALEEMMEWLEDQTKPIQTLSSRDSS